MGLRDDSAQFLLDIEGSVFTVLLMSFQPDSSQDGLRQSFIHAAKEAGRRLESLLLEPSRISNHGRNPSSSLSRDRDLATASVRSVLAELEAAKDEVHLVSSRLSRHLHAVSSHTAQIELLQRRR